MSEESKTSANEKEFIVLCTNSNIIMYVRNAIKLMDADPIDIYTVDRGSPQVGLALLRGSYIMFIDKSTVDPYPLTIYTAVAVIAAARKGKTFTNEEVIPLVCATLMRKTPPGWTNLIVDGLRNYMNTGTSNHVLPIIRFLADRGHNVEVVIARHTNTSQAILFVVYVSGLNNIVSISKTETGRSFTEYALARMTELTPYCNEPNFTCRLELGAQLRPFSITDDGLTTVRRTV